MVEPIIDETAAEQPPDDFSATWKLLHGLAAALPAARAGDPIAKAWLWERRELARRLLKTLADLLEDEPDA